MVLKANIKIYLLRIISTFLIAFIIIGFIMPLNVLADNGDTIVHVTRTGYSYHRAGCWHLRSDIPITLYEAVVEKGYNPCEDCNPPIYDGSEELAAKMEKHEGGTLTQSNSSTQDISKTSLQEIPEKEHNDDNTYVFGIIIATIFFVIIIKKILVYLDERRKKAIKDKEEKEQFEKDKQSYYQKYAYKNPLDLVDMPKGDFFKEGYPCTNNTEKGVYGDYTVYVSASKPKVLHINPKCGGAKLVAINYYQVCDLPYCKRCVIGRKINLPKIQWYIEYLKIVEIKKKYDIP